MHCGVIEHVEGRAERFLCNTLELLEVLLRLKFRRGGFQGEFGLMKGRALTGQRVQISVEPELDLFPSL